MFRLLKRTHKDPREELKALLGDYELQGLPAVVMTVLGMLRDPEARTNDIADKIQMDIGMSIKILRLINSVAFGLMTQVSNLHHAVTILGHSRLESMLLTYAVTTTMPSTLGCMQVSDFWLASARRACLARRMAQRLHPATQSESFTAALLQDLAIPLISESKGPVYEGLVERWHTDCEADIDVMERELLGYDHPSIGALIAEEWGFSEYLIHAIGAHHDLSAQSPAEPAVRLVSLVRYFDSDDGTERLLETADRDFGVSRSVAEQMISESFAEAEEFARTLQ